MSAQIKSLKSKLKSQVDVDEESKALKKQLDILQDSNRHLQGEAAVQVTAIAEL